MAGLHSWTGARLLRPYGNYSLISDVAMKELSVNVTGYLTLDLGAGPALRELVGVSLALDAADLEAIVLAGIADGTANLTLSQVLAPRCLVGAVRVARVQYFNVSNTLAAVGLRLGAGPLEDEAGAAVNALLALIVHAFGEAAPLILNGLVMGPGRRVGMTGRASGGGGGGSFERPEGGGRGTSARQLPGAVDAQTAHPATSTTAPAHQRRGSANAETTPARAPAAAAVRKQRPDATCEGKTG